ncbi:MAG: hypothetical protein NTU48_00220 [Legionellales bacterium]|nr:hypothetical protein [Legionellales bacterium]
MRDVGKALGLVTLTNDELVEQTRASIGAMPLPTGEPVPRDIRAASNALVTACDTRLKEIEAALEKTGTDLETKEELEEEKENLRNMLNKIYEANTKPNRTWKQFWADNAELCALVKPQAIAREIGILVIQAEAVAAVAAVLAIFVFPPLGMILAALVVVAFCVYKLVSAALAIGKAWAKSNENLARRQLNLGEGIKNDNMKLAKGQLDSAVEAKEKTAAALAEANKELKAATSEEAEAEAAVELLEKEKNRVGDTLAVNQIALRAAEGELAQLQSARLLLTEEVATTGSNLSTAEGELAELESARSVLASEADNVGQSLSEARIELERLKGLDDTDQNRAEREKIGDQEKKIIRLEGGLSSANEKLQAKTAEREVKQGQVGTLRTDLSSANEKLQAKTAERDAKQRDVEILKVPVTRGITQLAAIDAKLVAPNQRLATASAARGEKETNVRVAEGKDVDAGKNFSDTSTRVAKLSGKLLSPLAKVSAAPAIDPTTGRKPAASSDNSAKYHAGYGQGGAGK